MDVGCAGNSGVDTMVLLDERVPSTLEFALYLGRQLGGHNRPPLQW
jgi:hypothetical protein